MKLNLTLIKIFDLKADYHYLDDEMEDAPELPSEKTTPPEPTAGSASPKTGSESRKQSPEPQPEPKPTAPTLSGRCRGRRRVSKKVTTKDEEGYIGMIISFSL